MQRLVICVLLLRALGTWCIPIVYHMECHMDKQHSIPKLDPTGVLGQDAGSYVHPLSNLAEPLDGVYTSVWFPETKTTTKKFEAGKPVCIGEGCHCS